MKRALVIAAVSLAAARAVADADPDQPAPRKPASTAGDIFGGPFTSSRLFAMPVADVVGAYMISASLDGSLLEQPGVLTSESVIAAGFGDLAQLEYRHTEVVSVTGVDAPVPTVGVRLPEAADPRAPERARDRARVSLRPATREELAGATVTEAVTDLYIVMRERLAVAPWLTLHAGVRYSPASPRLGRHQQRAHLDVADRWHRAAR